MAYPMHNRKHIDRVLCISAPAHVDYLLDSFAQTLAIPDTVIEDVHRRMDERFDQGFWQTISTVVNVRELDVPALVIHDGDDHNVPWQQGKIIANAWPGARFMKTTGLGHGRILRDAGVVTAAVDFIGAYTTRSMSSGNSASSNSTSSSMARPSPRKKIPSAPWASRAGKMCSAWRAVSVRRVSGWCVSGTAENCAQLKRPGSLQGRCVQASMSR